MSEPVWGVLTRAADRLGARADDFDSWRYDATMGWVRDRNGDLVAEVGPGEGAWIAALSPVVAAPLVELLRDAARRCEANPEPGEGWTVLRRSLVEFARLVLGEEGP